jgi:hypothetical protein
MRIECRARIACGAWLLVVGVLSQGCGDTAKGDTPSGTTAGPAQGASHLVVNATGTGCSVGDITTFSIPTDGSTSSSTVGAQIVDDVDGAAVDCSVKEDASGFSVLGTLQSADGIVFAVGADIGPSTGDSAYQATGKISHYAPTTTTMRGIGCTITVSPRQGANIGPGKIWADFACPAFNQTSTGGGTCAATGTFVFANCTG